MGQSWQIPGHRATQGRPQGCSPPGRELIKNVHLLSGKVNGRSQFSVNSTITASSSFNGKFNINHIGPVLLAP